MKSIYFASTPGTYADIYCSILQTWVIENFIIAARSLCILEAFASYGNSLLKWTDDSKKSDVENTDDDGTHIYTAPCKRRRNGNAENGDTPGDQRMNDDGRQHEDEDNTADQQESTGDGDDGDDGDDDDSDNGSGDDDEYYEEEEESDDTSSEDDTDDDPLLTHAREVYASNYFRVFEREYRRSRALSIDVTCEEREVFEYKVHRLGDYSRKYKVVAQWFGGIVSCSCNYFSITGFLCCHCLAVLPCLHVDKITDCYLLRWQMKDFSSDQIQRSSLPRAADDSTKVSRDTSNRSLYDTLYGDENCTDVDYIVTPLLRHAKEIYVQKIYDLFREEYKRSEFLSSLPVHHDLNERGIIAVYQVSELRQCVNYMVYSEPANGTVNCTCRKFAATGMLCSHALHVLYVMDVVKIPLQYIKPSHVKGGYDVGNDNNGKIHGSRYAAHFENFARWRVKEKRIGVLRSLASKCEAVGFDSGYLEGCLGELSKGESSKKEEGRGDSVKSPKSEILFWDDQGIKSFTYKKPVMIRKLYLNRRIFTRYSP